MQDFRKLMVWQKSYALTLEVYRATKDFPKEELYSLTNQIRRASSSVPANIAEGCGRFTDSEFLKYLDIAMGSASELDCYLMLSHDLGYLPPERYNFLQEAVVEVKKMLTVLILKIRNEKQ